MATCKITDKGFKTIECTRGEMAAIGSYGICDNCCGMPHRGVYVAVLNRWFCPGCYMEWHERAEYFPEDARIEDKNFEFYKGLLGAEEVQDA